MMQNGFRRIALAQGLLPDRLPSRQIPANAEPADALRPDATAVASALADAWNGSPAMQAASPA